MTTSVLQRNARRTRGDILAAIGRLFSQEGLAEVTYAAVARESGVSERTVYRYFPSKPELLIAFWEWLNLETGLVRPPEDEGELLDAIPAVYAGFDRKAALVRAYIVSAAGRELHARNNPARRRLVENALGDATAGLAPGERRKVHAVVQLLFSARGWASMTDIWGLSGPEAGEAARWAASTLLDAVRAGSRPETPTDDQETTP